MSKQNKAELLQGTLDMLILKSLQQGPQHGYQITRWLETASKQALTVEEGSLYPALHRMERKGWITSEWGKSESNRRAKYYSLTKAGRAHLVAEHEAWQTLSQAVSLIMRFSSWGDWRSQP